MVMLINISGRVYSFSNNFNFDSVEIVKIGESNKHLKYYREERGYSTFVVCSIVGFYENDIFHPAYCMNKELPGAESGSYNVNIKEILNNPKVWRVVSNGYPYKTPEEMGLEDEKDAFAVTKFAIYCVLGQSKLEYYSADPNDVVGQKMLEELKRLVEIGNNEEYDMNIINLSLEKVGELIEDNGVYVQEYKVNSNIKIQSYKILNLNGFPEGCYVANRNNMLQNEFFDNENFKIMIPINQVKENIDGKIEIIGKYENYPIFYGEAPENKQDYILTYDKYGDVSKIFDINLSFNNSKIKVIKIDEDSEKKLKSVKFELKSEDEKYVKAKITDSNGMICFENLFPGKYILKEIETIEDYEINEEEFCFELAYNMEKEIIVTNELKKGKLKIIKYDKENNFRLAGVSFELYDENMKLLETLTTNEEGEVESIYYPSENKKYYIKEVDTIDGYILNDEIIEIELISGKTVEYIFKNEKIKLPKEESNEILIPEVIIKENTNEVKLPKTGY